METNRTEYWKQQEISLNDWFSKKEFKNFFQNDVISGDMCVDKCGWLPTELEYLESKMSDLSVLEDSTFGNPNIMTKYKTTGNMIHHLYHLKRFEELTNKKLQDHTVILEWGGGYGNMCKLVRKLHPNCVYIIVDLPIMNKVQKEYLSNTIKYDSSDVCAVVNVVDETKEWDITAVNLISVDLFTQFASNFVYDMFISTWAISESGHGALECVINNNILKSKSILIAYQNFWKDKFPIIDSLVDAVGECKNVHIEHIPNNYYLMR